MTVVPVELGERRYDVVIEAGVLARAGAHLAPLAERAQDREAPGTVHEDEAEVPEDDGHERGRADDRRGTPRPDGPEEHREDRGERPDALEDRDREPSAIEQRRADATARCSSSPPSMRCAGPPRWRRRSRTSSGWTSMMPSRTAWSSGEFIDTGVHPSGVRSAYVADPSIS